VYSSTGEFYSVYGGTPAYIMEADPVKDVFTNIEDNILRKDSFLKAWSGGWKHLLDSKIGRKIQKES
jgi:hypothetical protein